MKGWKTWVGAFALTVGKALTIVPEPTMSIVGQIFMALGAGFGVVGIGHKIEKARK